MEPAIYYLGLLIVVVTFYRIIRRRFTTPQATVRNLLKQYHFVEQTGLPPHENLFRLLRKRPRWRNLPPAVLAEIVARLGSKENVFRFVSLAEEYKLHSERLPALAAGDDLEAAMHEIAVWLIDFGTRLQDENRLKEAEFVQKLALSLQPAHYLTKLSLASTYYKMENYGDALPLLESGLAELDGCGRAAGDKADFNARREMYDRMHAACLSATRGQKLA